MKLQEKLNEIDSCDLEDVFYPLFRLREQVNKSVEYSDELKDEFNSVVNRLEQFHSQNK